jgi:hypothetical protein
MVELALQDCPHCGTQGILVTSDNRCPNCKHEIVNPPYHKKVIDQNNAPQYENHTRPAVPVSVSSAVPAPAYAPSASRNWNLIFTLVYIPVFLLSVVFGIIAAALINNRGSVSADTIAVISWFIVFPLFILSDAILSARLLWCPLRACALPLVEGFVIYLLTDWQDPFAVSLVVSLIYAASSLIISGISFAVRKSRNKSRNRMS